MLPFLYVREGALRAYFRYCMQEKEPYARMSGVRQHVVMHYSPPLHVAARQRRSVGVHVSAIRCPVPRGKGTHASAGLPILGQQVMKQAAGLARGPYCCLRPSSVRTRAA